MALEGLYIMMGEILFMFVVSYLGDFEDFSLFFPVLFDCGKSSFNAVLQVNHNGAKPLKVQVFFNEIKALASNL